MNAQRTPGDRRQAQLSDDIHDRTGGERVLACGVFETSLHMGPGWRDYTTASKRRRKASTRMRSRFEAKTTTPSSSRSAAAGGPPPGWRSGRGRPWFPSACRTGGRPHRRTGSCRVARERRLCPRRQRRPNDLRSTAAEAPGSRQPPSPPAPPWHGWLASPRSRFGGSPVAIEELSAAAT